MIICYRKPNLYYLFLVSLPLDIFPDMNIQKVIATAIYVARNCSMITGKSKMFHFFDFLSAYIIHGCSDNHYLNEGFYRLRSFDRRNTVTKRRKNQICKLFNDKKYISFFSNKVIFNETFSRFVGRNWIYTKKNTKEQVMSFIDSYDKIIVKPLNLNKGKGIYLLDKNEIDVEAIMNEEVLLEEYINQHPDMCFGSKSVNSIRVITVLDRFAKVHILKAGLRCGVGEAIVDNFSAGGAFYPLNLKNGFVEGYGEVAGNYDYSGIHPGTDIMIIGRRIPHWKEVLQLVENAANVIPQIRYVGWDVAVLPDRVELIEGNDGPGCTLLECIGEERGFYKRIMSYL